MILLSLDFWDSEYNQTCFHFCFYKGMKNTLEVKFEHSRKKLGQALHILCVLGLVDLWMTQCSSYRLYFVNACQAIFFVPQPCRLIAESERKRLIAQMSANGNTKLIIYCLNL